MTDLSSDLAAIRARCEAYANAHAPYSEDDLWELNLTPDAVPFFLHAQSDLPRLLARLEEMRGALNRVRDYFHALDYGGKKEADMIVDDIRKRVSISLRPLDVPG